MEDEQHPYVGTKDEEMDAEGAIVDEERETCLQCGKCPRAEGALCEVCRDNIPF